ncbi:MAG: hypothetical protein ACYCT2_04500 [Thermoplasmataceae archaeon]
MSLASSIMSSPVWGFLQVLYRFFQNILSDLENTLITPTFQSVTQDFVQVFRSWQGNYGVLTPMVLVASAGFTFVGLYLLFAFVVPVKDMVGE